MLNVALKFKVHTYKGFYWCDYCKNFLWGLEETGTNVKVRFSGFVCFSHFIGVNYGNADFFFIAIFEIAGIMLISNALDVLKEKIVLQRESLSNKVCFCSRSVA